MKHTIRMSLRLACTMAAIGALAACGGRTDAQPRTIATETGPIRVETVASGLEYPWGLAFLPDGRMLVTERPGRLRIVGAGGELSEPLSGLPEVAARGQGGLLDVALAPDFATSRMVYLSFAEANPGGASTAVARGRLGEAGLRDTKVIFRQQPKLDGGNHFGSRLVFAPDGMLFVTLGERFAFEPAQNVSDHIGTIVRIAPDGSVPVGNPLVGRQTARPEIWSWGHRNVQGAALHPETGQLWISEHGPRGGDEINIVEAGRNYGWPLVSWGRHYSGGDIPDPDTTADFVAPVHYWPSAIAPSGLAFYTGDLLPRWRGNLLAGGLVLEGIARLTLEGNRVAAEEQIDLDARIRDVRDGPGGAVYLLTDASDGAILKLVPAEDG